MEAQPNQLRSVTKQRSHINRIRSHQSDVVLQVIVILVILLFCAFCILPFIVIVVTSFEKELNITRFGYSLYIRQFSTAAYELIIRDHQIPRAYGVTIFTTLVGTLLSMLATITMAYPLSLKKVRFRKEKLSELWPIMRRL